MRVRLVVRVDVERPVREAQRLCKRLARVRPTGFLAGAAASCEHAGHGEECPTRRRTAEQMESGQAIGHSDPSSESTTNVLSGLQLSVSLWPAAAPFTPGEA